MPGASVPPAAPAAAAERASPLRETEAYYRRSIDAARESQGLGQRRFSRSPTPSHEAARRGSTSSRRSDAAARPAASFDSARSGVAGYPPPGSAARSDEPYTPVDDDIAAGLPEAAFARAADPDDDDADSEAAHPSFLGSARRSGTQTRQSILPSAAFLTPLRGSGARSPLPFARPPSTTPAASSPTAGPSRRAPSPAWEASPQPAASTAYSDGHSTLGGGGGWAAATAVSSSDAESTQQAGLLRSGSQSVDAQDVEAYRSRGLLAPRTQASRDPLLSESEAAAAATAAAGDGKLPAVQGGNTPSSQGRARSRASHLDVPSAPHRPASSAAAGAARPRRHPRKHAALRGANRFFCAGRIMMADDNPLPFLGAVVFMLALPTLWFVFVAPWTWRHLSPAVPIVFAYIWLVSASSMAVTSWRDPGVIPRDLDPDPPCSAGDGNPLDPEDPLAIPLPRIVRVPQGADLKVKWCETCGTYRPPRASHCRTCDNCVENIDHHCTFLNTCIGRRNYVSFFAFLGFAILACVLASVFSALHLYFLTRPRTYALPRGGFGEGYDFRGALAHAPLSAVMFLLPIGTLVPLCTLWGYHVHLVSMNRTTVEAIRISTMREYEKDSSSTAGGGGGAGPKWCYLSKVGRSERDPNPFASRNPLRNAFYVLSRPVSESWIDRYGRAVPDTRLPNPAWRGAGAAAEKDSAPRSDAGVSEPSEREHERAREKPAARV